MSDTGKAAWFKDPDGTTFALRSSSRSPWRPGREV
jgi:hypothetical protein